MSVYTQIFPGKQISPSQVDYVAYVMMTDIHAVWPFEALPDAYITPNKIDLQAISSGLRFFMGKADLVSPGQDCLITNRGNVDILVTDVIGDTIVNIQPGLSWMVWVEDNDTPQGVWRAVQFGASASQATAGALAGAGLRAVTSRLDQNLITSPLLSDYIVNQGDRAKVLQNNGGSVTWTADTPANLGNGFFFYLMNSGTGTVTFTPPVGAEIDHQTSKVFQPGENAVVFSDGFNFFSLGYGRSLANTVTGAAISLAPGGTRVLTPVEVAAQVQDFSGALTSDAMVEYGTGVGYWFVWNNTNGPHLLQARTNVLDTTPVTIPQGNFSILRSNGSELEVAFTATTGTVTSVGTVPGELVGGPITSTGIIGLADTGVVPGSVGAADRSPIITFDQKGRATSATDALIAILPSQVIGLDTLLDLLVPPGTGPIPFAGGTCPSGWLMCDGASYTTAAQPRLFAAIQYRYGGSGANFNVPDMRGVLAAGMDLMPGSLQGNANRLSSVLPSTTIGGFGGSQITNVGVSVSGGISGSTFGGLSVQVSVVGTTNGANQTRGFDGGGNTGVPEFHDHNINFQAFGGTSGSLGVTGSFSGSGGTNNFGIVQPTRVFMFIIKA